MTRQAVTTEERLRVKAVALGIEVRRQWATFAMEDGRRLTGAPIGPFVCDDADNFRGGTALMLASGDVLGIDYLDVREVEDADRAPPREWDRIKIDHFPNVRPAILALIGAPTLA